MLACRSMAHHPPSMSRILHTADWHLGARLNEQTRSAEHVAFLGWLLTQMEQLRPDLLIIAGDVFDHANPPQEALAQYYGFLAAVAKTIRCQVLVLAGNHDSPSVLQAPREILAGLQVTVVAEAPLDPAAALLELPDAVVCAVPFLRDRDVRRSVAGQTALEIASALREGIAEHYRAVREAAEARANGRTIIGTGHLTALSASVSESERAIHIGNLGAVDGDCFRGFAYTALGHIHKPQAVGGNETVRYAGTPIPLDFSELGVPKEIRLLDLADGQLTHQALPVPTFRRLARVTCTRAELPEALQAQAAPAGDPATWIELKVSDGHEYPDIGRLAQDAAKDLNLLILKHLPSKPPAALDAAAAQTLLLQELQPRQVFAFLLTQQGIAEDTPESEKLLLAFDELLEDVQTAAAPALPAAV